MKDTKEVRDERAAGKSHTRGISGMGGSVIWLSPLIAVALLLGPRARAAAPVHQGGTLDATAASLSHPGFETVGPNRPRNARRLPLVFEANDGQADASVKFLSRASGFTLLLTSSDAVLAMSPDASANLRLRVVGGNPTPKLEGLGEMPARVNYLLGPDRSRWRRGIRAYEGVRYRSVYPGVDLVYRAHGRRVEFDFHVSPGADPSAIALALDGAPRVSQDGDDLVVSAASGELRLLRPRVYQRDAGGSAREIPGAYRMTGNTLRFRLGRYDASRPLVIDPLLDYATYAGGTGNEKGEAVALDPQGSVYLAGTTSSASFLNATPTTLFGVSGGGLSETFVAKLDASGVLQFLTYVGGPGNDLGHGIAVDSELRAYVAGETDSVQFPVEKAMQPEAKGYGDAFLFRLSADGGILEYSTFIAGNSDDRGYGVAVDANFHAFVAGSTSSTPGSLPNFFPVTPGAFQTTNQGYGDAFVTRIDTTQAGVSSLVSSTLIGGDIFDAAWAIAADGQNVFITGWTDNAAVNDFPVQNAFQPVHGGGRDAFVAKLDASLGTLVYASFIGGSGQENGTAFDGGIAVDGSGNAIVVGTTTSPGLATPLAFQTALAGGQDAFVTKVDPLGNRLYTTYLGGSLAETGTAVAVDALGAAYVTGATWSPDFPLATPTMTVSPDAFLARLNAAGTALVYATYLGGGESDQGQAVALDADCIAHVAGTTGSLDFPTTAGVFQEVPAGGEEAFVAKIATGYCIADLALRKTDAPDPVAIGGIITYTLGVTNHGPSAATNVQVQDALPSPLQFVGPHPLCSESGGVVTCNFGTLAANGAAGTTFQGQVLPPVPGPILLYGIVNTATVSADQEDPDPSNNSSTATTMVSEGSADLSLTKTAVPAIVAGDLLAYTLTVTNNGPDTANDVVLTDHLDTSVILVPTPGCGGFPTLTCQLGSVPPGTTQLEIKVRPTLGGTLTNGAFVGSTTFDPDGTNNLATVDTLVTAAADLQVTKLGSPGPVNQGAQISYTLTVVNNGVSPATGVKLTDTLPANVSFVSASGVCSTAALPKIVCPVGNLASGANKTFTIDVLVSAGPSVSNTASVTGDQLDPVPGNNSSTAVTTVNPPNLWVIKTGSPSSATSFFTTVKYTITVWNVGGSNANGVVLTDYLPVGMSFQSASPGCSASYNWIFTNVTCPLGTIWKGMGKTRTISVIAGLPVGLKTNTATATLNEVDPDLSNNTATANTLVHWP